MIPMPPVPIETLDQVALRLRMIIPALFAGVAMMGTVMFLARSVLQIVPQNVVPPIVPQLLVGIAITMVPISAFAFRLLKSRFQPTADEPALAMGYLQTRMVPAAILDAGAIASNVAYFLDGQLVALVVGGLLAAAILTLWPTASSVDAWRRGFGDSMSPGDEMKRWS